MFRSGWVLPSITGLVALGTGIAVSAAEPSLGVTAQLSPAALGPGDRARLRLELAVPEGFHLWSLDPGPGPKPLTVELGPGFTFAGPWYGAAPESHFDRGFQRELTSYPAGTVVLERWVERGAGNPLTLTVRAQICTEAICLNQVRALDVPFEARPEPQKHAPPPLAGAALTSASDSGGAAAPVAENLAAFLLVALLAGLGALATPCVFPAIPLTVSFFSKYSAESFGRGARLAAFYAFSMIVSFTSAGVLLSLLFGVSGVQKFAAHPLFNLALGALLIVFSLNLLGMFEIRAPMFLVSLTQRLENRYGPGARRGHDYLAVFVAALTSTTVFFTCTVAFVGVVVVAASTGDWLWPALGMLVFATTFSLPFFLLALFPQAARKLRGRSGQWLELTRVTLGFLELAAATKFLSNADLIYRTGLLGREVVLAFWVALFALCGLFLLGKIHLGDGPRETDGPIAVPRLLSAAGMLSFTLYLSVGLFSGRPLGGWVDGWLPPGRAPAGLESAAAGIVWRKDLAAARAEAEAQKRLVFINYTGYTCTNCRYMESAVFTRPEIAAKIGAMVPVELYTDDGSPENDQNRADQVARYRTTALPFYAIETADGTPVANFPSSTNDPAEFLAFLDRAFAQPRAAAPPDGLVLKVSHLADGSSARALAPGKWTLINFWATWCAPCRAELQSFLARLGSDFTARGGHFVTVAVEAEEGVSEARQFLSGLGVAGPAALRLPERFTTAEVDPRFSFEGSVPFTVLVGPTGEIVWRSRGALDEAELRALLERALGS